MFTNLIINAKDAMPKGGQIVIRTANCHAQDKFQCPCWQAHAGEYVKIEISDNGIGIPEGIVENIFEPFFTTKGEGKGTGLGLAICKGIVLNHGGKIWVKSKPGKGSTFAFTLRYKSRIGTKKRSVELFHFNQEETLYKFSQRIVEAGYELREGMGNKLLEADLLRQDGRLKSHISLKDLEKKGYIKKVTVS